MRAITVQGGRGAASALQFEQVAMPTLQDDADDVLVKIRAFALNRMDIMQREGMYPVPPGASEILGVEFSGEIAAVGAGVQHLEPGDAVFGLAQGGAYAEYIRLPASMTVKKPTELSWEQAAAIPEAFLTAYQALDVLTSQKEGEDVLIHAGASGVGIAAVQLARVRGARNVYVTAGSQEKIDLCVSLGATQGFNYKTQDWAEELKAATNGAGVDVILDFIGAPYFAKNLSSLRRDGRLSMQALMGGPKVPDGTNLGPILTKRLRIEGSTLRSRTAAYQAELLQRFQQSGGLDAIVRGVRGERSSGAIQLILHAVRDWHLIEAAHEEMEANKNAGKMVMTVS